MLRPDDTFVIRPRCECSAECNCVDSIELEYRVGSCSELIDYTTKHKALLGQITDLSAVDWLSRIAELATEGLVAIRNADGHSGLLQVFSAPEIRKIASMKVAFNAVGVSDKKKSKSSSELSTESCRAPAELAENAA